MRKTLLVFFGMLCAALVVAFVIFWPQLRGAGPALSPTPATIAELIPTSTDSVADAQNATPLPLHLPAGFHISIFAKNLGSPRVIIRDPKGRLLVSIPSAGTVIALTDANGEGVAEAPVTVLSGLNQPHGLALRNCPGASCELYVAEMNRVTRFVYDVASGSASHAMKVADLSSGGRHITRTLLLVGDSLLISVGSSCDVCRETDPQRAKILELNLTTGRLSEYASGLRNAVFLTQRPGTDEVWATEMGHDYLGDNLPPDEINVIQRGKNYGWPLCYGQNVLDTTFDKNAPCTGMEPSRVDLQAHSAPLGLAFIPSSWPTAYRGDLLVAFHGSWNRTAPTGYSIVRIPLSADGRANHVEDFISGWLTPKGALGRPVSLLFDPSGALFVTDDKAGVVYRVTPPIR